MRGKLISPAAGAAVAAVMLSLAGPVLATAPATSQPTSRSATSRPTTAELKIVDIKDSFEVVKDYTEWTSYIARYCGIEPIVLPGKDFDRQLAEYERYKQCVERWNERWRREHPGSRFGY